MIPMNLLGDKKTADFVITGSWSKLAMKEAQKFGSTHVAASSEDKNFNYIPTSVNLSDDPAYLHFTSNNTIFGTQFKEEPKAGKVPLVCDASSDIFHKKIDINKYALVYAGAQKNLGPAGVTLVIIRKDLKLFEDAKRPVLLDYNTYVSSSSLYNTPPTLPIYVVGEVLKWIRAQGGLDKIYQQNLNKAKIVYDQIDSNLEFFEAVAEQNSRSLMNITFRLKNKDLEGKFIKEAESQGLNGLKGHRSVGGMRASIYNAFPAEGATALATFMKEFAQKNG
jgi:phosphoserine aminotransferase